MKIAKEIKIVAIDYANQGNTMIGIRGSGKTYGAGKVAEELMEAGIPIVAFDPTGVWQNLRNGVNGNKGYPVVVAGGQAGDIPLTKENAVLIMEAALKAGISIIFDLRGINTTAKASWMHIVYTCVDYMLIHNDKYGPRHIFIEEAAEFVPQRPYPGGQMVYSKIESLARMGRNYGLGYTLINQRAEEIAKAIFEICEQVFVFRQAGKNSLKSIRDWLDYRGIADNKKIIESLPNLANGQCWIVNEREVVQAKILPKKTFHPDPKLKIIKIPAGTKVADTAKFIVQIKSAMEKPADKTKKPVIATPAAPTQNEKVKTLEKDNRILSEHLYKLSSENMMLLATLGQIRGIADKLLQISKGNVKNEKSELAKTVKPILKTSPSASGAAETGSGRKLGKCEIAIMQFLAAYPGRYFSRVQIAVASDYSPTSSGFANSISSLNSAGLIIKNGTRTAVNNDANLHEWIGEVLKKEYSIETFKNKLGKCEREIYEVLIKNPHTEFTREDLAAATESNYSTTSSGYANSLSSLNTLELIKKSGGMIRLNPELLEI